MLKSNKKFKAVPLKDIQKVKYYKQTDLEYMKSLSSAVLEKSTIGSRLILWVIILSIAWLLLWANNAQIDELARGNGKVIPTHKTQVVQNLEGGIVSKVFVKEGDIVKVDQPLLKLQDIRFSSSFEENQIKINELQAKMVRLSAEAQNKNFILPEKSDKRFMALLKDEESLYYSDMKQLESSLDVISSQLNQRKSELLEANAKKAQLQRSLNLIEEEITMKKPLVKRGVVPEIDFITLKREKNDIEGNLEAVTLSIPRIKSTINEARKKYTEVKQIFQNKAKKEFNDVKAEYSRIKESITALSDRVYRTVVRSPVAGTIQQLFINTRGGVIKPGMDIVEIIPMKDNLIIEAKIKPSDIAFLHVGQKAIIKFTAYDFSIYGGLDGEVNHISADTITDEEDNTFYLVHVKANKDYLNYQDEKLYVKVGMVTSVDIITGKKTVLDYILKPILKAKNRALRER
ncbi:HlyD family type I secretion periplasmic adaptor subunit [Sulfurospirillum arcachonense]|uniref:HlyD family type I secretion periplasmic adaptor subunit n=1 Tax=Sulfurospirillum arcachonense TaxID=57666 RepID=UPI000468A5D3|nr:HlyD family type I secretion periplasmic adaptor subunit [Sulfurospirillum arcachonense]